MKVSTLNWLAAGANAAALIGLGIYFLVKKGNLNFNTTLYNLHITDFNIDNPNSSTVTATPALDVTGLALKILIIVYFVFTVLFHILYASDFFKTGIYTRAIANRNNFVRWIEYGISSSIMTFIISVVVGVKSLDTVILLVVMNIGMILCGQISEASITMPNGKPIALVAILIGWILLLGIVGIFFKNFFMALSDANNNGFKVPWFVYTIIFSLVGFYSAFGFVNLWWILGSDHSVSKYIKIEKAYITLSFFSKITLGLFLGYGLTRPPPEKKDE